jgi:hypothetical protein
MDTCKIHVAGYNQVQHIQSVATHTVYCSFYFQFDSRVLTLTMGVSEDGSAIVPHDCRGCWRLGRDIGGLVWRYWQSPTGQMLDTGIVSVVVEICVCKLDKILALKLKTQILRHANLYIRFQSGHSEEQKNLNAICQPYSHLSTCAL